jgi:hypothetical protein
MKKFAIGLLAMVVFLNACTKDDAKPAGSFTISGQTGATPYGYFVTYVDHHEIDLGTIHYNDSIYHGIVNFVYLNIDTLIDGATYSFLPKDSSNYDKTRNFYNAGVAFGSTIKDLSINTKTGKVLQSIQGGTVTLKKVNTKYQLDYTIRFLEGQVTGTYVGDLPMVP